MQSERKEIRKTVFQNIKKTPGNKILTSGFQLGELFKSSVSLGKLVSAHEGKQPRVRFAVKPLSLKCLKAFKFREVQL